MEYINSFSRGLHTDTHELFQPEDTYRFAVNFIRDVSGALRNERGTINVSNVPTGLNEIGATVLDDRVILFLCSDDDTINEIGVFNSATNTYSTVINSPVLNFSMTAQVDAISRINFNHEPMAYYVDGKNPPRKINIDNPPLPADYAETTQLIRNLSQPIIDLAGVIQGGSLISGGYQFAIRYVDGNTNKTPFSKWCNTIPVPGTNPKNLGRTQYIGGNLSNVSGKSIVLNITELDALFPFIEIGVRYLNSNAQEVFKVVDTIPINSSTLTYTFSTMPTEEDEDISNAEATVGFPDIATAKCIEQKDNRAFISNIVERQDDAILQQIANGVLVSYVIEEIDHYDDNGNDAAHYQDYKLENMSFNHKGYQRDEVYSLGFGVIWKSGNSSFVYHIPARLGTGNDNINGQDLRDVNTDNRTWVAPTVDTSTTGQLGTYVSTDSYPQNQDYPTDGIFIPGSPDLYLIRHHLMPSLEQQPHFGPTSTLGATNKIRPLGLKFTLTPTAQVLLTSLGDKIQGIVFYREPRGTQENTSVFGQGITKNLYRTINTYAFDDGAPTGPQVFKKEPLLGNYYINQNAVNIGGTVLAQRRTFQMYPVTTDGGTSDTPGWQSGNSSQIDVNRLVFFGPDVYLDPYKLGEFNPSVTGTEKLSLYSTRLNPVLKIRGDVSVGSIDFDMFSPPTTQGSSVAGIRSLQEPGRLWQHADYKYVDSPLNISESNSKTINPNNSTIVESGDTVPTDVIGVNIDNSTSSKFLYLQIAESIVKPNSLFASWLFSYSGTNHTITYTPATSDTKILYNLTAPKVNQYGQIGNKRFSTIQFFKNVDPTEEFICFNGDVFISRYWFRDQDIYRFRAIQVTYAGGVEVDTDYSEATERKLPDADSGQFGFSFKDSCYLYVESRVNPDYQHEEFSSFYQKTGIYSILSQVPYTESNNEAYNKTYSGDNEIGPQFTRSGLFKSVGVFETRTYYSQVSTQGEFSDSFSEFRVNDYYDLPKHTGEIIDTFVLENNFYMHCPQALWLGYVNPQVAQVNDIGEVFTGTGTIFSIPAKQIFTINGGYAGTTSHWAGCNTPFGRFFIDNRQGKAFMFSSNGIEEISNHGMFRDFLSLVQDDTDNPANGVGYTSIFDYSNKRWLLSRVGVEPMTISYYPELKSWTSYHSYYPTASFSVGNKTYLFRKGLSQIHELSIGSRGVYFGDVPADSELTYVTTNGRSGDSGAGPADSKVFDNAELHTLSYNLSGQIQLFDTFNRITCNNEYQTTGEKTIISTNADFAEELLTPTQILSRQKKSHFQIAIPREEISESRLKSPWMQTHLLYSNAPNNELIVSFTKTKFRYIFR